MVVAFAIGRMFNPMNAVGYSEHIDSSRSPT